MVWGLKGIIENLSDGRVRIIAEGDEEEIKLFEDVIDIKNTFIRVATIEKIYWQPFGDFGGFCKLVGTGETDSRQVEGIGVLKDMRDLLISICGMQKQMLAKQEETLFEIKDMNHSLNDKMDKVLDKSETIELKGEVSEMKSTLRAKGII